MASFFVIPTLAGQAALAASQVPGADPVVMTHMVVGDGNGNAVVPLETQTELVRLTATVPITSLVREGNLITVDAILDQEIGGFTIREAGLVDEDGVLLYVASVAETEKLTLSQGEDQVLTLGMYILVADTANITFNLTGTTYASHDYVNEQIQALRTTIATPLRVYHITAKSITQSAPPSSPTPGDVYVVAADATGLWAGQVGKLAQYVSEGVGWLFVTPPVGHIVSTENGLQHQRAADGKYYVIIPANAGTARVWMHEEVVEGIRSRNWSTPRNLNDLLAIHPTNNPLLATHQFGVWNPATNTASKSAIEDVIAAVAARAPAINGYNFFWSGH